MLSIDTLNYRSQTLLDHSQDELRSGEGSIVELKDGSLYLAYSEFIGGGTDNSRAYIAFMISSDRGKTWSSSEIFYEPPPNTLNAMAVSLLRLRDGKIGCMFGLKISEDELTPYWATSEDEGKTWSEPLPITQESGYFVINNDRLVQLRDGTLAIPYALHIGAGQIDKAAVWNSAWNAVCGLFYSKDGGLSWTRSPHSVTHTPEVFVPPLNLDPAAIKNPQVRYLLENRLGIFQEPGLVELGDGSLMLYMRSNYCIYRCFATAADGPWTECAAIAGVAAPTSPQTIRLLPEENRLVMLYNDAGRRPFGSVTFQYRSPLAVALSDDNGRSWTYCMNLEDETKNCCYFSLLFTGANFFTTYYESVDSTDQKGVVTRRNLATLKLGSGEWAAWKEFRF